MHLSKINNTELVQNSFYRKPWTKETGDGDKTKTYNISSQLFNVVKVRSLDCSSIKITA